MRRLVRRTNVAQLPPGYAVDTHFNPTYDPWDQRMCLVPDGDLFRRISDGRADVVTDRIDTFTETGLRLARGSELEADIVVTATGLNLKVFGGIELSVDGEPVKLGRDHGLQRDDAQRRAQLRLHHRLHERLVDAQGRPGRGVRRAGCSSRCERDRHPVGRPRARPGRSSEVPLMDFDSGYVAAARSTRCPAGRPRRPW